LQTYKETIVSRVVHLALLVGLALVASTSAGAAGVRVFRGPGIVLRYPGAWFVTNAPLNGISDPVQRFVLSSYRVPDGGSDFNGTYTPPRRGVIAQVLEEVPPLHNAGVWLARPHRFVLPPLGRMEGFGGKRWAELRFRQHGRRFYIFIGIGSQAPGASVALLLRSLDALRIARH
jgi:hypothetical protein